MGGSVAAESRSLDSRNGLPGAGRLGGRHPALFREKGCACVRACVRVCMQFRLAGTERAARGREPSAARQPLRLEWHTSVLATPVRRAVCAAGGAAGRWRTLQHSRLLSPTPARGPASPEASEASAERRLRSWPRPVAAAACSALCTRRAVQASLRAARWCTGPDRTVTSPQAGPCPAPPRLPPIHTRGPRWPGRVGAGGPGPG